MASISARATTATSRPRTVVCRASLSPIERVGITAAAVACSIGLAVAPAMAAARKVDLEVSGNQSPIHVTMKVEGLKIKPASEGIAPGTGHFHILIDQDGSVDEGDLIPFDDLHKHYGKGQIEDDLVLSPGKHKLTLQFANALHESYGPKYAVTKSVVVKAAPAPPAAAE